MVATSDAVAHVGISIDPLIDIQQRVPITASTRHADPIEMTAFARHLVQSFLNYGLSFAQPAGSLRPVERHAIPVDVLLQWCTTVERRIMADPSYWKTI